MSKTIPTLHQQAGCRRNLNGQILPKTNKFNIQDIENKHGSD